MSIAASLTMLAVWCCSVLAGARSTAEPRCEITWSRRRRGNEGNDGDNGCVERVDYTIGPELLPAEDALLAVMGAVIKKLASSQAERVNR